MEFTAVKDSGAREEYSTGAVRDTQDGKPRYDLIPQKALKRLAQHYSNGARKYSAWNWSKGMLFSRLYASTLRHIYSFAEGDVSEDHLSAAIFNLMAMVHFQETGESAELDDMQTMRGPYTKENKE